MTQKKCLQLESSILSYYWLFFHKKLISVYSIDKQEHGRRWSVGFDYVSYRSRFEYLSVNYIVKVLRIGLPYTFWDKYTAAN